MMTITDFLDLFPRRRQNSPTDWHVPCPAHDDNVDDPAKFSLHVTVTADLFLRNNGTHAPRDDLATPEPTPTLAAFAALKGLTQSVLETCGWRNHDDGLA